MITQHQTTPRNRAWAILAAVAATLWSGGALAEAELGTAVRLRDIQEWTVVVGEDAIPSERYAAEEFCRLFKAATGSELKTVALPSGNGDFYIGESAALRAHSLGFSVAPLGEEGLRIRIARTAMVIAGGRPRGTLYGVYEFFERYLGVRFLTKDDTYIPADAATMTIPLTDYQYVPPFSFRWSYYAENSKDPAFAGRLRVNKITDDERLGGQTSQGLIGHSIATYVPAAVYGQEHPEYFALVNGVRKLGTSGGPQVCSLNPDVIKIVCAAVERALDAAPSQKNISVSPMDNDDFCQCPACSALGAQEESMAAPHLVLVNAVADRIAKTHPGVRVGTLIYWHTRKPPKTLTLRSNAEIQLCSIECCTLHPLDDPDCKRNRVFYEDFARWKDICQNIWIWNYNTDFSNYDLPFPNFNAIAKNIQLFRNNHARGVFMQAAGNGLSSEMSDLRNYVMARCLWRPTEEGWALVDEFCRLHYGAAARPILAYLRFLHQNAEARGVHPDCFPWSGAEVGLDAGVAQRLHAFFQEALKLAPDDTIRARVEKAMIPTLRALLSTAPLVYENGRYRLDASAFGADTLDRYIALAKKYGMNMGAEVRPLETYIVEWKALHQGLPAVLLENQVWRVVLLPEQNGLIVELLHKKTGHNLVNKPTAGFTRWNLKEPWPEEHGMRDPADGTRHSWETKDGSVVMTRTLPDGSVWRRTVALPSESAAQIKFHAEFIAGEAHAGWQVREQPVRYAVSRSENPYDTAIYTLDSAWKHVNRDWQVGRWVQQQPRPQADTTAFAFYDHKGGFGMQQTFVSGTFARFKMDWSSMATRVLLEMFTPVTPIQKGQKLSFSYELGYLEKPPLDGP